MHAKVREGSVGVPNVGVLNVKADQSRSAEPSISLLLAHLMRHVLLASVCRRLSSVVVCNAAGGRLQRSLMTSDDDIDV